MKLTREELALTLEMLRQVNFPSAEVKILAGQLQVKIEQEISKTAIDVPVKD